MLMYQRNQTSPGSAPLTKGRALGAFVSTWVWRARGTGVPGDAGVGRVWCVRLGWGGVCPRVYRAVAHVHSSDPAVRAALCEPACLHSGAPGAGLAEVSWPRAWGSSRGRGPDQLTRST